VPIVTLLKTSNLTRLKFKELFIFTAVQAVRVGGILYFILFLLQTYLLYSQAGSDEIFSVENRLSGPYWLAYWFPPLMNLLLTQLLWIRKLYMKKGALITMSLLLLFLPSPRFIIFITAFHRDYLPSSWSMYQGDMILGFVLNIIVFIFIIFTIMLAGNKFKKIKE
jgi:hypothetical protein